MIIPLMRLLEHERSSAALARRLEMPPPAVVGALRQLRDTFGAVVYHRGEWQLSFAPQWLDATALLRNLQTKHAEIKLHVHVTDETAGTNDWAKHFAARQDSVHLFYTEHQTRGRGRRGRQWLDMPGGSVMLSVSAPAPPQSAGLSLAVGAALWQALSPHSKPLQIKWPNDLLDAAGRKVGGILAETFGGRIIIGVGINLMMSKTLQKQLNKPAAALDFVGGRHACALAVGSTLLQALSDFAARGLPSFMAQIERAHYIQLGQSISFAAASGEVWRGRFVGFDTDGALLLRRGGGVQRCLAGEIGNVAGC